MINLAYQKSLFQLLGKNVKLSLCMINMDGPDPKGHLVIVIEDGFLV